MLITNIQRPENYNIYDKHKQYWSRIIKRNSKTDFANLNNPVNLGDKMSWCTLYYKYNSKLFNKIDAKNEVAKILNTDKYCIPTYQIAKNRNDIDYDSLIGKTFVIKPRCMAESKGVIIVSQKLKKNNIENIKEQVQNNKFLQNTSIVIEKYICAENSTQNLPIDYKCWCYYGTMFCCELQHSVGVGKHESLFVDKNFKKMDIKKTYCFDMKNKIKKPRNFKKMIEIVEKIAQNMPVVRVDMYNINGKIYFGECQKIYSYHCAFEKQKQNEDFAYLLPLNKLSSNDIYFDEISYDIKNNRLTTEAKQILNCNDEDFEFIFSKEKFPIYFNNKNKSIGIFNYDGFWYQREYLDNFVIKPNTNKKIYNKNKHSFEPIMITEAAQQLDCRERQIKYSYDKNGNILYYNNIESNICISHNNGNWEKAEYETIKRKIVNLK